MVQTTECPTCGKEVLLDTPQKRQAFKHQGKLFCSRECYYKSKIGKPRTDRVLVTVNCHTCGKQFVIKGYQHKQLRETGRVYCSKECSRQYQASVSSLTMAETNRKYASARMKQNNPMRNPATKRRMQTTLRARQWKPQIRGGNGTGYTVSQRLLALALGWQMEYPVYTGKLKEDGYPVVYKIDIADPVLKVAIEVDGASHNTVKGKQADERKTAFLVGLGWKVLRFSNRQVMSDLDACVQTVLSTISK